MMESLIGYSSFNNVYTDTSELPKYAHDYLSNQFLRAFEAGLETVFDSMAVEMPNTFKSLMDETKSYKILENVAVAAGKSSSVFYIGLELKQGLLLGPIYNKNTSIARNKDYLKYLRRNFHALYQHTDGLSYPGSEFPGVLNKELPRRLNNWELVDDYRKNHRLPARRLARFYKHAGHKNLKIWIENSKKDLVVVDCAVENNKMYHIANNDFDSYKEIDDIDIIDRYCSWVICAGTVGEFAFHQ